MARGTKINTGKGSVGDIMASMLDLAQFQAENGTDWVLADGTTAAATKYNTITAEANLPDLRGVVLRGRNYARSTASGNADNDQPLGTLQLDELLAHDHSLKGQNNTGVANGTHYPYTSTATSHDTLIAIDNTGGNETRMRNVTVNHFIKVN